MGNIDLKTETFVLSSEYKNNGTIYIDAVFETMSGFTTTGSSVINDVDSLTYGLKFWRAISQWMGGLGIVVFTFALVPTGEILLR